MIMNIVRQPKLSIRKVKTGTAIAVPKDEAQLKMPVASPRSRGLNQFADHARAGRKLRRLADAQEEPGAEELAKALDKPAQELGERPSAEAECQEQARPELVDHGAGRQLRERVGPEKGG